MLVPVMLGMLLIPTLPSWEAVAAEAPNTALLLLGWVFAPDAPLLPPVALVPVSPKLPFAALPKMPVLLGAND